MRNCLLILIAATHLLGNTELGELLKIPRLISHYQQHRCNDSSVGFIDFIVMHYVNGDDGTSADNREDEQLPCHNSKQQHSFAQTLSPTSRLYDINLNHQVQPTVFGAKQQEGFLSGHVSLILQPPRV
jgi:hypothetical protein